MVLWWGHIYSSTVEAILTKFTYFTVYFTGFTRKSESQFLMVTVFWWPHTTVSGVDRGKGTDRGSRDRTYGPTVRVTVLGISLRWKQTVSKDSNLEVGTGAPGLSWQQGWHCSAQIDHALSILLWSISHYDSLFQLLFLPYNKLSLSDSHNIPSADRLRGQVAIHLHSHCTCSW